MQRSPKSIFRPQAMRRYAERAVDPVFPKSAMPRAFMLLWALLGLLGLLASLAFSSSVPIYARGVAAFALPGGQDQARKLVVILVPTDQVARLQIGQRVLIRPGLLHDAPTGRITFIYPETLSQQQIQVLADNTASSALTVSGSKVVALAELDPASANVYARGGFPGGCEALVEVGSRRVLTLIRWGQAPE